jgi:hypothetical protein
MLADLECFPRKEIAYEALEWLHEIAEVPANTLCIWRRILKSNSQWRLCEKSHVTRGLIDPKEAITVEELCAKSISPILV